MLMNLLKGRNFNMIDNEFTVMSEPCLGKNTDPNCKGCCNGFENVGSANIRPNYPDPPTDCNGLCDIRDCHNPLHNYLIKFGVMGLNEKFVGQAYVLAHNLKEAQCVFGTQSAFNGMQQRLKITSITEVPPCPEPILVQEDSVAIIDKRQLKTYPFLLKSDFQVFVADIHQQIINGFSTPSHLLFNINGVQVGDYHPLHDVDTVINLNNVTITDDGLMSKEDKLKLDSLGLDTTSTEALTTSDNELFNNVIQLHKISKTGTFSDLLDVPDGKLTIKKNDTVIDEFTDNANEDKEISLVVNDGELNIKYDDTSLGTFTADQANNSIINLPLVKHKGTLINIDNNNSLDIPTEINDATQTNTDTWSSNKIHSEIDNSIGKGELIIQKNGTNLPVNYGNNLTKQAFGANDFDYCIVNIPVPTQTSELTNNGEGVQGYPFITKAVNNLENYYTEAEVDNLLSQLETNIDWKEAVNTYNDIATTYPNPQDGWTVNVKDTDYTYRYNGTEWVAISANAIPLATQSVNGLMSSTDKTKLDGIEADAEVNVQSDWNQSNTQADDYIKNKPVIPTITFRQWNTTE